MAQQSRSRRLRARFGPEYDRRVKETNDRRVVERELTEREKRHAQYKLRPLSEAEQGRYAEQWTVLQEQFVDRPGESVAAAPELVHVVMRERGYPAGNVERYASDLSVEHAPVVDSYRGAHDIRTRHEREGVSTEELRQALTHLRAVFVSVAGLPVDQHDSNHDGNHATTAQRHDAATATPDAPTATEQVALETRHTTK